MDWNEFWDTTVEAAPSIIDRFHLGPARERELALEEQRLAIQRDALAMERASGGGGMQLDPTMLAMIGGGLVLVLLVAR